MGYASQRDGRNARIPTHVSDVIEIHQAADGRWYWLRRSRNGRVVTDSQMFRRKWNAKRAGRREARTVSPELDVARMDQQDAVERHRADIHRSYRRAAVTIAVANALDVALTFRALDHGHTEGNPIASWMIDHWLIIPAKLAVCAFILAVAFAPAAWFAARLSEVSVRRVWFVAGVYSCVVLVGVLANLR